MVAGSKEESGSDLFNDVFGEDEEEKRAEAALKAKLEAKAAKATKEEPAEEEAEKETPIGENEEADAEKSTEENSAVGEEEEKEPAGEAESAAEEKPAGGKPKKRRAKKAKAAVVIDEGKKQALKEVVGAAVEVHRRNEEKGKVLREKIKKIVVAKAEKAAEKDDKLPIDREEGIKEVGAKAEEAETAEETGGGATAVGGAAAAEKPAERPAIKPTLRFLGDNEGNVFIGRKESVFQKYGRECALFVGEVAEEECKKKRVLLDSLNPHVIFVCGARGSGKSYALGVIAEELALHNKNVGTIVIDPVGVFWSMRFPNKEERELQLLAKWQLMPQGLENLKVFIPVGMKEKVPENTYDEVFSIPPSLLTTDDWCLTFGIDRFSPSGLLLEKSLMKVKQGYKNKDGKQIKAKKDFFSLEELLLCLHTETEINSPERGYRTDSIRALASRFDAAKNWGVFDERGTPLVELSREKQLTIIDTSFLEDNVAALVIGILARRVLAARKVSTRQESSQRYEKEKEKDMDKLLEFGIPPTWLFIDEAHTLIPSGNVKTPASSALIEYVKQGRQPGCSIVFATQQPSAIDTKVLSQLDVMISYKLVFDDDIKAVYKRTPAIIPKRYKSSNFIKTLPVGVAMVGDRREETSRAFIATVRPRMSQHEGREAVTSEREAKLGKLGKEKVLLLAVEMVYSKLESIGCMQSVMVDELVKTLDSKYESDLRLSDVLKALEKKGVVIDSKKGTLSIPGAQQEEALVEELVGETEKEVEHEAKAVLPEEEVELLAFPAAIGEEQAKALFNMMRKKKLLGIIGDEEAIDSVQLRYLPVFKILLHAFNGKQTFHKVEAYVNSASGEFMHVLANKKEFVQSRGMQKLDDLSENEVKMLSLLAEKRKSEQELVGLSGENEAVVKRALQGLAEKGFVSEQKEKDSAVFSSRGLLDLPATSTHSMLASLGGMPLENVTALSLMREKVDRDAVKKRVQKLWKGVIVKSVDVVYLPVFESFLKKKDGSVRRVFIEAVFGKQMELADKGN
ncbi:MAG: DUF853 family protein [Candidatus Diapherotrites archaeon]|nr:DUF853 family protein [Candidatus Diapherotrites archaeon]